MATAAPSAALDAVLSRLPSDLDASVAKEVVVYSYYRDAELRGSNLPYLLLRMLDAPESQIALSEHLADETRHAWLWTERIRELAARDAPELFDELVDTYRRIDRELMDEIEDLERQLVAAA